MSEYNYSATDDDDEHGERYGVQTLTVEYDPTTGRALTEPTAEVDTIAAEVTAGALASDLALAATLAPGVVVTTPGATRVKVICSCGHYTCPWVVRFGHPEPVYHESIEPLPSQYARDERALALRGGL